MVNLPARIRRRLSSNDSQNNTHFHHNHYQQTKKSLRVKRSRLKRENAMSIGGGGGGAEMYSAHHLDEFDLRSVDMKGLKSATVTQVADKAVQCFDTEYELGENENLPTALFLIHQWFLPSSDLVSIFLNLYRTSDNLCDVCKENNGGNKGGGGGGGGCDTSMKSVGSNNGTGGGGGAVSDSSMDSILSTTNAATTVPVPIICSASASASASCASSPPSIVLLAGPPPSVPAMITPQPQASAAPTAPAGLQQSCSTTTTTPPGVLKPSSPLSKCAADASLRHQQCGVGPSTSEDYYHSHCNNSSSGTTIPMEQEQENQHGSTAHQPPTHHQQRFDGSSVTSTSTTTTTTTTRTVIVSPQSPPLPPPPVIQHPQQQQQQHHTTTTITNLSQNSLHHHHHHPHQHQNHHHQTPNDDCETYKFRRKLCATVRHWILLFPMHFDENQPVRQLMDRLEREVRDTEGPELSQYLDLSSVLVVNRIRSTSQSLQLDQTFLPPSSCQSSASAAAPSAPKTSDQQQQQQQRVIRSIFGTQQLPNMAAAAPGISVGTTVKGVAAAAGVVGKVGGVVQRASGSPMRVDPDQQQQQTADETGGTAAAAKRSSSSKERSNSKTAFLANRRATLTIPDTYYHCPTNTNNNNTDVNTTMNSSTIINNPSSSSSNNSSSNIYNNTSGAQTFTLFTANSSNTNIIDNTNPSNYSSSSHSSHSNTTNNTTVSPPPPQFPSSLTSTTTSSSIATNKSGKAGGAGQRAATTTTNKPTSPSSPPTIPLPSSSSSSHPTPTTTTTSATTTSQTQSSFLTNHKNTRPSYAWLRNVSVRNPMVRQVSLSFDQWTPDEIANNLTHIEHRMLRRITSLSSWVQCMVLSKATPKERAEIMLKFINVGKRLKKLQNFNTLMAVLGGLTHSSLARLTKTHAALHSETRKELNDFAELLSSAGNFSQYRKELNRCKGFKIPIIGVHLKDLISLHSAMQDWVIANGPPPVPADESNEEIEKLVNCKKFASLATIFSHLILDLDRPNHLPEPNMDLINTLKVSLDMRYKDDEIYELSLKREPRNFLNFSAVFKHYDHNGDGYISKQEFDSIAGNFPFIDPFVFIDADRDGQISQSEMRKYFIRVNQQSSQFRRGFKHNFHETTFLAPTTCIHCTKVLWGILRQGYKCKDCGLPVHRNCKDSVVAECRKTKVMGLQRVVSLSTDVEGSGGRNSSNNANNNNNGGAHNDNNHHHGGGGNSQQHPTVVVGVSDYNTQISSPNHPVTNRRKLLLNLREKSQGRDRAVSSTHHSPTPEPTPPPTSPHPSIAGGVGSGGDSGGKSTHQTTHFIPRHFISSRSGKTKRTISEGGSDSYANRCTSPEYMEILPSLASEEVFEEDGSSGGNTNH